MTTEADIITRYTAIWRNLRPEQRTDQKWSDIMTCCRWDIEQMEAIDKAKEDHPSGSWQDNPISRSWVRRWLHL